MYLCSDERVPANELPATSLDAFLLQLRKHSAIAHLNQELTSNTWLWSRAMAYPSINVPLSSRELTNIVPRYDDLYSAHFVATAAASLVPTGLTQASLRSGKVISAHTRKADQTWTIIPILQAANLRWRYRKATPEYRIQRIRIALHSCAHTEHIIMIIEHRAAHTVAALVKLCIREALCLML
jgi:hypothetical protein